MLIKKQETNQKIVGPMKINEYKINPNFSGALIEIDGDHGKLKCVNEDRVYFIIDGTGKFVIEEKVLEIEANDVVFVPKNTVYNFIGKFKFFLICSPEFNPDDDVFI